MKLTDEEIKKYYPDVHLKSNEFMMACRCGWRGEIGVHYVPICPVCRQRLNILQELEEFDAKEYFKQLNKSKK